MNEVEGSCLSPITLVELAVKRRIEELPLGKDVTAEGVCLTKLLKLEKVLGLGIFLRSLLIDLELTCLVEGEDVPHFVEEATLLVPENGFGPGFFLLRGLRQRRGRRS